MWYDALGNVGVLMIVAAYLLLQMGRLAVEHRAYSVLNALGAALILLSLFYSFNLPAFLMEFFWLLISLYGLFQSSRKSG